MIVLGIDQSYNSTGIVVLDINVLDGDNLTEDEISYSDNIIHSGKYKSNPDSNRFGQAHEIAMHIASVVDTFKPDMIAIEGLAFGMKGNVTRDLGGLQFVIVAYLQEVKKKSIKIMAPLTVKKYATGSGRAKKEEMIKCLPNHALNIFLKLGVKKTTGLADLADAYWIAKSAHNKHKEEV